MRIFVDQSIKIDQTFKDSCICAAAYSKELSSIVIMDRRLKRMLINKYKKIISKKKIVFLLFAFCAAEAVESIYRKEDEIILDREYRGNEFLIEEMFYSFCLKLKLNINRSNVSTQLIGKHNLAHIISRNPEGAKHKKEFNQKDMKKIEAVLDL